MWQLKNHTYPYYDIISPTGDVAIKKPKVRMMDFHGLSLRPLVVKGLLTQFPRQCNGQSKIGRNHHFTSLIVGPLCLAGMQL